MAEITNVSKLIINYLTEEQYQTAKASDLINENELYIESTQTLLGVAHPAAARFVIGTSTAGWSEKDCDYLCDGTADQTEINAAITALPATGGEVVILDGTYNITAKIGVTKDNVSIRGNGNASILKRMFNSSALEGIITLTSRSGCKIANLQIDGNQTSYTSDDNCGIYLDTSSDNTVTSNTCSNNYNGIYLISSSNNTVPGNTCNNNARGIYLYQSSNNNTVTGNTCNNNSYGVFLSSSSNNTVTGNTCIRGTGLTTDYTASQRTIQLSGTGNSYNLISNNNCMGKAVTVGGGTGNSVYGNKFDDRALVDSDIAVSPDVATALGLTGNPQVKDALDKIANQAFMLGKFGWRRRSYHEKTEPEIGPVVSVAISNDTYRYCSSTYTVNYSTGIFTLVSPTTEFQNVSTRGKYWMDDRSGTEMYYSTSNANYSTTYLYASKYSAEPVYGNWSLCIAIEQDAYPNSGISDNWEYLALGELSSMFPTLMRMVEGTYKGTGTYGVSNKNVLEFDSPPKVVFISRGDDKPASVVNMTLVRSDTTVASVQSCPYDTGSVSILALFSGNQVMWYNTSSAQKQNNISGHKYNYCAIL